MTRLGVGLTHVPGLDRVLAACGDLLEVVEIEPQTLWRSCPDGTLRTDEEGLDRLAELPGARLLHGVGNPVGGCRPPDRDQLARFAELAERLGTPWVSEHLAFNRVRAFHHVRAVDDSDAADAEFQTGFMLPLRQTPAGVSRGIASVRAMADALPVPLAVEVGTNYLRPRPDELSDGEFVARIAAGAGCGLLLDLHNILANQRNGRCGVDEILAALPLDRIWEVHLAGGSEHRGYWLDAHSGLPDDELMRLAERVLPRLPGLRAVLFEVAASAVPQLDIAGVRDLLVRVKEMWPRQPDAALPPLSPLRSSTSRPVPPTGLEEQRAVDSIDPEEWEYTLGSLSIGRNLDTALAHELSADPALPLLRELIMEFRGSALAGTLVYTLRLLLLTTGIERVREILETYTRNRPPLLFPTEEAFAFADHLRQAGLEVPWLDDVLELDLGFIRVQLDGRPRTVSIGSDPTALLTALGAGRIPVSPPRGPYRVQLVDDRRVSTA